MPNKIPKKKSKKALAGIAGRINAAQLKKYWTQEFWENKYLMLLSLVFLVLAMVLNYITGTYVQGIQGVAAPDLILDHIPSVDLHFIYIYGAIIILAALFVYPLLFNINKLHIVISQFSLLMAVRGVFTCFTHLALPAGAVPLLVPPQLFFLDFTNDLFFSGHTAVPFLGFLLFRKSRIRFIFLASSVLMASVVLLMHVHYTIDVLSAFFITYGSYMIGETFFVKINSYLRKEFE